MLKKEFQHIINHEIEFHGKRFQGETKEAQREAYIRFNERYYESLGYLTENALKAAFRKCREQFEYFPKINQLLKFAPVQKEPEKVIDYKALPQSEESKRLMKNALKGGDKHQLGEKQLRANFAHIATRWPNSNWDEPLKRAIELDSHRAKRPTA